LSVNQKLKRGKPMTEQNLLPTYTEITEYNTNKKTVTALQTVLRETEKKKSFASSAQKSVFLSPLFSEH
jgi:hypothetical protein